MFRVKLGVKFGVTFRVKFGVKCGVKFDVTFGVKLGVKLPQRWHMSRRDCERKCC